MLNFSSQRHSNIILPQFLTSSPAIFRKSPPSPANLRLRSQPTTAASVNLRPEVAPSSVIRNASAVPTAVSFISAAIKIVQVKP